jgi:hypothetical protein
MVYSLTQGVTVCHTDYPDLHRTIPDPHLSNIASGHESEVIACDLSMH